MIRATVVNVPATALLFCQNLKRCPKLDDVARHQLEIETHFSEAVTGAVDAASLAVDFPEPFGTVTVGAFLTAGPATEVAGFAVTVGKPLLDGLLYKVS